MFTRKEQRMISAYLTEHAHELRITRIDTDWRSRPRQKITRTLTRAMPHWQRLAVIDRANSRGE